MSHRVKSNQVVKEEAIKEQRDAGGMGKKSATPQYSRVVPHRTTDWALRCLSLQIGRDAEFSTRYGRT